MTKAINYYRKSIELEADKSIEGQKEEVHRYAAENNIEIVAEFEEVASSATIDRKELNKMFEFLSLNKDIDYILLHRFDRITREVKHMGYFMTLLETKGKTRLHSVTESNDYEDDPTKLMLIMMETYGATIERINAVKRMQGGRKRKQDKGGFIGGTPPIGYRSLVGSGDLAIEQNEIPIVQMVFKLRNEGCTMEKIAAELNAAGFNTRKNKPFYAMTVSRILKNESWYEGKGLAPAIL